MPLATLFVCVYVAGSLHFRPRTQIRSELAIDLEDVEGVSIIGRPGCHCTRGVCVCAPLMMMGLVFNTTGLVQTLDITGGDRGYHAPSLKFFFVFFFPAWVSPF